MKSTLCRPRLRAHFGLMAGTSLLVLCAAATGAPVFTQDKTTTDTQADAAKEVVVVGVRKSLKTAQQIKKSSDTVVDSITATDIGAFPDKSVAEALQRVPGVTVSRFAQPTDTRHYTGEASGVIVRGLPQVRSEFNGRDTFSANADRGLGWEDVTPELMAGVDTYKSQTADMTEGGIAGTINLRTRTPFDSKGKAFAFSADESYTDKAKDWSPNASVLFSDRWNTSLGEFGLLVNLAGSQVVTTSQGVHMGQYNTYDKSYFGTATDVYIPSSYNLSQNTYTRDRTGIAIAGQWKSNGGNLLATVQYNRSDYRSYLKELDIQAYGMGNDNTNGGRNVIMPYGAGASGANDIAFFDTPVFDSKGFFVSGTYAAPAPDCNQAYLYDPTHTVKNDQGQNFFDCASDSQSHPIKGAGELMTTGRVTDNRAYTQDLSGNLAWTISDTLKANFDLQYVDAQTHEWDMESNTMSWAKSHIDMSGKFPTMTVDQVNVPGFEPSTGGLTNENNFLPFTMMDHTEDDNGHEFAGKFDLTKELGTDWLDSVKVGVRYSDREQTVRWSAYNWHAMTAAFGCFSWNCQTNETNIHLGKAPWPADFAGVSNIHSNILGGVTNLTNIVAPNLDYIIDRNLVRSTLSSAATGVTFPFGPFTPICSRPGEVDTEDYGCYLPKEIQTIGEKTTAIYGVVKFGGKNAELINGITVSGNFGVRVIRTDIDSNGYYSYPQAFADANLTQCKHGLMDPTSPNYVPGSQYDATVGCSVDTSEIAYNNGGASALAVKTSFVDVLPSFNIKFQLNDDWISRFSYAKGLSRPDIGLMRNFTTITTNTTVTNNIAKFTYVASRGNPYLRPTTADSFDFTLEDYFAPEASFTVDVFYKNFLNYVTNGSSYENIANNGTSRDVLVTQPINGKGASITGVEFAYQRFFDFLPAPFDGLGIQTNYTLLHNTGISNGHLNEHQAGDGTTSSANNTGFDATSFVDPHALVGVSNESYNLVGMYEKGPWALRMAYNWRSDYLVTDADCCNIFPLWQKAQGFLDASARYKLNDHVELSVQGTNLLNTVTQLTAQVDDRNGRTMAPYIWYENDRRIQFGIRYKY